VFLGLAAMTASGASVYLAHLDRLATWPGVAAVVVALYLVVVLTRGR
jgi:hypothetical protein